MKLFRTIITFDVVTVANDPEAANAAVVDWIKSGDLPPSETNSLETRRESEVRPTWRERKPIVGADITDAEFNSQVKGNTAIQLFEKLYTKKGPSK